MELATSTPLFSARAKLLVLLFNISKPMYKFFFKQKKLAWKVNLEDLNQMPCGSLGKDLYKFLRQNQFDIEPKLESHDIGHVLLNYTTDVVGEVCMQFFYLGSGKKSVYSLLTTILGYLILPEQYKLFHKAYKKGKTAINFQDWDFEYLLTENTNTLRAQIFQTNKENTLYI